MEQRNILEFFWDIYL